MANNTQLNKKFDEVLATIEPQTPQVDLAHALFPAFHLFTTDEQTRLYVLFDEIEPRVSFYPDGQCNLDKVTNEELDTFSFFEKLYNSLVTDNQAEAAKYRRWLTLPRAEVVRRFLSLNLDDKNYHYLKTDFIRAHNFVWSEALLEWIDKAVQHTA